MSSFSLSFILLTFSIVFFIYPLWVQKPTTPELWISPMGKKGRRRQKKMSRGFGSGVPRVVFVELSCVRGASPPSSLSSAASQSCTHTYTHSNTRHRIGREDQMIQSLSSCFSRSGFLSRLLNSHPGGPSGPPVLSVSL